MKPPQGRSPRLRGLREARDWTGAPGADAAQSPGRPFKIRKRRNDVSTQIRIQPAGIYSAGIDDLPG